MNLSFIRKCARALPGLRAYAQKPNRKGKNVSVIGAISLKGLLTQWSGLGSIDTLTFDAFIARKLVPQLWPGAVVIMDNCSIHKSDDLVALLIAAGAHLIYLPPYSPDFSPIENCWSKIKNILRRIGARTYPDLLRLLRCGIRRSDNREFTRLVYSLLLLYFRRLITAILLCELCLYSILILIVQAFALLNLSPELSVP